MPLKNIADEMDQPEVNPAFPISIPGFLKDGATTYFPGFSKRELIAAMALQGSISSQVPEFQYSIENEAKFAVKYADALIAELNKEVKG